MTRAAVREVVTQYLTQAQLPFVGTVFPVRTYVGEFDFEQNAEHFYTVSPDNSGCVMVVNLPTDDRQQKGWVGRGFVDDTNVHQIVLELFLANTAGDVASAQNDYDQIVDALFEVIRANANLGNAAVIWSAGEFDGVKHAQTEPFTDPEGLTVHINGTVRFSAYEWLKGQGV